MSINWAELTILSVALIKCHFINTVDSKTAGLCEKHQKTEASTNNGHLFGEFVPQCDENGNFQPTQCNSNNGQCWCVNIDTGQEILGTRRRPGQYVNCNDLVGLGGPCKAYQNELLIKDAGKDQPFFPSCTKDGFYSAQQCQSDGQCFCVDTKTGEEIKGTRTKANDASSLCLQGARKCPIGDAYKVNDAYVNCSSDSNCPRNFTCNQVTISPPAFYCCQKIEKPTIVPHIEILMGSRHATLKSFKSIQDKVHRKSPRKDEMMDAIEGLENPCEKPKDPGNYCNESDRGSSEETRWYFNRDKFVCLAFQRKGCGGNANTFPTKSQCEMRCKPQDGPTCSGNVNAYDSENGTFIEGRDCRKSSCPQGWTCRMGWLFAVCCNKTVEEIYDDAYSERCHDGSEAYMIQGEHSPEPYFGETCNDLRCTPGYSCKQKNLGFAKCCSDRNVLPAGNIIPNDELHTQQWCATEVSQQWYLCVKDANFSDFALPFLAENVSNTASHKQEQLSAFNRSCSSYFGYVSCVDKLSQKYPRDRLDYCLRMFHHAEMTTSLGFVCQPRIVSAVQKNFDCLNYMMVRLKKGGLCEGLSNQSSATKKNFESDCRDMQYQFACMAPIIQRECNVEMYNIMREYMTTTLQAMYGRQCPLMEKNINNPASNLSNQLAIEKLYPIKNEGGGGECSEGHQMAIYKCMLNFTRSPGAMTIFGGCNASVKLLMTKEEVRHLRQMCNEYEIYNECLRRIIQEKCDPSPYTSVSKLAYPLCHLMTIDKWEINLNCLAEIQHRNDIAECFESARRDSIVAVNGRNQSDCSQYRKKFFECSCTEMKRFCNADMAQIYMDTYTRVEAC